MLASSPLRETVRDMVAVPFTSRTFWGPRIEHLQVPSSALSASGPPRLVQVVANLLDIDEDSVSKLCWFGAVYYSPIMPQPGNGWIMDPQRIQEARTKSQQRLGRDPRLSVPLRVYEDCIVEEDGYIRVHCHPKRFPAALRTDWKQRILCNTSRFVVCDKPPAIKVASTVDNVRESLTACAAAAVSFGELELLVPHRLDTPTSGIVVLGKDASFVKYFCSLMKANSEGEQRGKDAPRAEGAREPPVGSKRPAGDRAEAGQPSTSAPSPSAPVSKREQKRLKKAAHKAELREQQAIQEPSARLRKIYKAVTRSPVPLGLHRHYATVQSRHRGLPEFTVMAAEPGEGSLYCDLRVLEVKEIALGAQCQAFLASCGAEVEPPSSAYEITIELLTGRTHQIRAQLALCLGCPLLGDSLYGALSFYGMDRVIQHAALSAAGDTDMARQLVEGAPPPPDVSQWWGKGFVSEALESSGWPTRLVYEPEEKIGLQASRMDVLLGEGASTLPEWEDKFWEGATQPQSRSEGERVVASFEAGRAWWLE